MSEKDKYPSELAERFQVRLPAGLRDRIKAEAERNGRSMNTEIVSTLEEAYPDPDQLARELDFMTEIDEIQEKLDKLRTARMAEARGIIEEAEHAIQVKKAASERKDEK